MENTNQEKKQIKDTLLARQIHVRQQYNMSAGFKQSSNVRSAGGARPVTTGQQAKSFSRPSAVQSSKTLHQARSAVHANNLSKSRDPRHVQNKQMSNSQQVKMSRPVSKQSHGSNGSRSKAPTGIQPKRNSQIKRHKNIKLISAASASIIALVLGGVMLATTASKTQVPVNNDFSHQQVQGGEYIYESSTPTKSAKEMLEDARNMKFETIKETFHDGVKKEYDVLKEEDVLNISRNFSIALERYLLEFGASYWTNPDKQQFWPEDIEYIMVGIAYKESTYRTNYINNGRYGGLTGFDEHESLKTLKEEWFTERIWDEGMPDVDCSDENFDLFNPNQCIEYTYHHFGYSLANWFKKDKYFYYKGERRCIWDKLDYSEEIQTRLLIANHLWGIDNILCSIYGLENEDGLIVPIEKYIYGDYVEGVLAKAHELKSYELIDKYENQLLR